MKKKSFVLVMLVVAMGLVACSTMNSTTGLGSRAHSGLTEQQKLIACSDCHRQATPKVYTEWYGSTHGIGGVKCYQCHNTFGNLVKSPDINQSCNSCHADKIADKDHTEGLATCWECHKAHDFTAK